MSTLSDYIEQAALADLHAAASEEITAGLGLATARIGGVFASRAAALPPGAIVVNRALGLGAGLISAADMAAIVAFYGEAYISRFFLSSLESAAPRAATLLADLGLQPTRAWRHFRRVAGPVPAVETTLQVREIAEKDAAAFGRIAADAFDLGPAGAAWLAGLVGRPGWRIFMSFDGDVPAGTGALFVRGRTGWCDWGATAPAFRSRGGQAAVLAARLRLAETLGLSAVYSCTGEAVPGDPQHSWSNLVRMGFRPTARKVNFVPIRSEANAA